MAALRRLFVCAAAAVGSVAQAWAAPEIILDDTFADGNRTGQNPPSSANWLLNTTSGVAAGSFQFNNSGSRLLVGYLTDPAEPVIIPPGESLTLELTFSANATPAALANGFVFGLLNSKGTRFTGNLSSTSDAAFSAYDGYAARGGLGNTTGSGITLRQRNAGTSTALMSSSGDWNTVATGTGAMLAAAANVTYLATLAVANHGTAVALNYTLQTADGVTTLQNVAGTDGSTTVSTFDTVALFLAGNSIPAGNLTLHRVKVTLSAAGDPITPPALTTHPASQTVTAGGNVTFTAAASGNPPPTYQWRKGGDNLPGQTAETLNLTDMQPGDAGNYTVVATNVGGSVTSHPAVLTVNVPPSITTQPASQTVLVGAAANFTVGAAGTAPLSYQWKKDSAAIGGATNATLSLPGVAPGAAGNYSVVVTNVAGSVTSDVAVLTVSSTPQAPVITAQPSPVTISLGASATFTVTATGTAPLSYQWRKGLADLTGATNATLSLSNVQPGDIGNYSVVVSNLAGNVTSDPAPLTVDAGAPLSRYSLTGFATAGPGTTGGGVIPETDPAYKKVTTPLEFAQALQLSNKTAGAVKVIEIMNDLDLGWNEVGPTVQGLASNPFRPAATPKLHPRLLQTGVSVIDVKAKSGLTIFSAHGATLRHADLNLKGTSNIIIRNLKFDELWEWDEADKGDYDSNDWDFVTLGNGDVVHNIWIDHCTFTKAYDGATDLKGGSYDVTFSWCKYIGDDGATNTNSWVRQQVAALEADRPSRPMYNFLRTNGFSTEDIVTILQGQQKLHLIGATSLNAENAAHRVTFHHQWWINPWDRLPRLRAGNVHNYNIYVDAAQGLAAKRLRETRANAMSSANRNTLNNTYSFNPFLNGSISTEGGAVLVEKSVYLDCLTPLRNNQTDPSDPTYTGKILALDTIYQFHNANNTLTTVRGNSTDAGNPLGPTQAPVIPFSWNLPGNALPYTYAMDDPAALPGLLAVGAGAGMLTWSKDNWLKTTYADTFAAPAITTQPVAQNLAAGGTATFTVTATSAASFGYQWFKDGVALPGQTAATLQIIHAQPADAGSYLVQVANAAGVTSSTPVMLAVTQSYTAWAATHELPAGQDGLADDANGDGIANLLEYYLGLNPASPARDGLPAAQEDGDDFVFRFTRAKSAQGVTATVQVSTDLVDWATAPGTPLLESQTSTMETYVLRLPLTAAQLYVRLRVTNS